MRSLHDKRFAAATALAALSWVACAPSDGGPFAEPRRIGDRCARGVALASGGETMAAVCKGPAPRDFIWGQTWNGKAWTAQQPVHAGLTVERPAVAVFRGKPYAVWRGDESTLWSSTYDAARDVWTRPRVIPGVESDASPALAVHDDKLFVAWRGSGDDTGLWWTTYDGQDWAEAQSIPDATSSVGPALGASIQSLMLVFKGERGDKRLHWSTFDGTEWAPPGILEGARTLSSPALAASEDETIYVAWRGAPPLPATTVFGAITPVSHEETTIWWTPFDGEGFGQPRRFALGSTRATPGLAVHEGRLCFAWTDAETIEPLEFACVPLR